MTHAAKYVETKAAFDSLLSSSGSKLIVVDFTASWCPPCQMIAPKFEQKAAELGDSVVMVKVDVDANSATAEACGITAMPTFHFYKNGQKIAQQVGANWDGLVSLINQHK